MAMICSMGMFGQSITISDDCLRNLPEETQRYVREHAVSNNDDDSSIGTEIGIAVNETFKAISDNTIKLAESNLGKSAIFMLSWKILYKDVIGLIVGIFLLVTVAVIMVKVLNQIKKTEDKNNGDFTETSVARVVLSGFSERRSGILKVYEQAKSDLETLNTDIQNQISANTEEMNRIAAENKQLANLKSNNESTIKAFTKLFR